MRFFLGCPHPNWIAQLNVPLFISRTTFRGRKSWPRARVGWALDSGAFSELTKHGKWTLPAKEYADIIDAAAEGIGRMLWAAPQDWMCEPHMVAKTGLTVEEHQRRTIDSVLALRTLTRHHVIPVLQGYTQAEYHAHVEQYDKAGVDLRAEPVVGLGSVCRRQRMLEAEPIVRGLAALGLRLHGFGVKLTGLARFADVLISADSMAWSYRGWRAMRDGDLPRTQGNCAHCKWFALYWRDQCLQRIRGRELIAIKKRTREPEQLGFGFPTTLTR